LNDITLTPAHHDGIKDIICPIICIMSYLSSPSTTSYSRVSQVPPNPTKNRLWFPTNYKKCAEGYPTTSCAKNSFKIVSRLCTHVPFMSSGKDGSSAMEVIALFGYSTASLPGAERYLDFSSTKPTTARVVCSNKKWRASGLGARYLEICHKWMLARYPLRS
jgi:hypothetical protein